MSINFYFLILTNTSRASQTPKGVIYGHSKKIIYEHLWLIDEHFWRKKTKDIYVEKSIYIYDEKHKNIYNENTNKMAICSYNK